MDSDAFLGDPQIGPLLREARSGAGRLKDALGGLGLLSMPHVDLDPVPFGAGFAIGTGDQEYVVVSVSIGATQMAYVTGGIAKNVGGDRELLHSFCNRMARGNPDYTTFVLDDPSMEWDVLCQRSIPIQLLTSVPHYFAGVIAGAITHLGLARDRLSDVVAVPEPYAWTDADRNRLLLRAML